MMIIWQSLQYLISCMGLRCCRPRKDWNEGAVKINEYGFSRNVEIQDYDR